MLILGKQIDEAIRWKDTKKAEDLAPKLNVSKLIEREIFGA